MKCWIILPLFALLACNVSNPESSPVNQEPQPSTDKQRADNVEKRANPQNELHWKETLREVQYDVALKPKKVDGGFALHARIEVQAPSNGESLSLMTMSLKDSGPIVIDGSIANPASKQNRSTSKHGPIGGDLLPVFSAGERRSFEVQFPSNTPDAFGRFSFPIQPGETFTGSVWVLGVERAAPGHRYSVRLATVTLNVTAEGQPRLIKEKPNTKEQFQDNTTTLEVDVAGHTVRLSPWNPAYELSYSLVDHKPTVDEPWLLVVKAKPWRRLRSIHIWRNRLVVDGKNFGNIPEGALIEIDNNSVKANGEPQTGRAMHEDEFGEFFPSQAESEELKGRQITFRSSLSSTTVKTTHQNNNTTLCADDDCVMIDAQDRLHYKRGEQPYKRYGKVGKDAAITVLLSKVWVDGRLRKTLSDNGKQRRQALNHWP